MAAPDWRTPSTLQEAQCCVRSNWRAKWLMLETKSLLRAAGFCGKKMRVCGQKIASTPSFAITFLRYVRVQLKTGWTGPIEFSA